jgi:hypothetical protein
MKDVSISNPNYTFLNFMKYMQFMHFMSNMGTLCINIDPASRNIDPASGNIDPASHIKHFLHKTA